MKKTIIPGIFKAGEGVLLNKDDSALKAYKARKKKDQKLDDVVSEIDDMKKTMEDMKKMLMVLISKGT